MNNRAERQDLTDEAIESIELRLRYIFIGSICLCFFIILVLMFVIPQWLALPVLVRYFFPAVLMWSLVVTAYVFYSQYCLSDSVKERLRRKSYLDEVTQVFNYRYLDLRLSEEAERTRRHGGLTAVLYLDLDGFKEVNDRFGHQVGNVVLEELATAMARQVRSCDVFGRIGGDEFLAILPQTDRREAYVLAERLRDVVENYRLELAEGRIVDFVRASVGVAAFPVNGETMENVITAADNAVYESKDEGGNRVTLAGEFISAPSPAERASNRQGGRRAARDPEQGSQA